MTRPVSVRIDEVVLEGVREGGAAPERVAAEVERVLAAQAPALGGRAPQVAAEVARAVQARVGT